MTSIDNLDKSDQQLLESAVAQVAVLIAAADGEVDEQEASWAEKITKIRSYSGPESLQDYYKRVGLTFDKQFHSLLETLPPETEARLTELSNRLAQLNPILAKLDNDTAYDLYMSLTSFAKHVAKASGGFLRMWSINTEEKKYIDLPMIEPIKLLVPRDSENWEDDEQVDE